ncbi:MAG: hypothetical protein GYA88_00860, partial [Clostridiales bacterium]|nr:hypothetical protein [Clostridiales bacterium]
MKRKIFSILLALCICLTLLPTAVFAGNPDDYNTGDIAIINAIIAAHTGKTGMTPANPDGSESPASW